MLIIFSNKKLCKLLHVTLLDSFLKNKLILNLFFFARFFLLLTFLLWRIQTHLHMETTILKLNSHSPLRSFSTPLKSELAIMLLYFSRLDRLVTICLDLCPKRRKKKQRLILSIWQTQSSL